MSDHVKQLFDCENCSHTTWADHGIGMRKYCDVYYTTDPRRMPKYIWIDDKTMDCADFIDTRKRTTTGVEREVGRGDAR